ncbi:MAG: 50S ribosomal protein L4 [Dehalococcoidia bacterium]
MPIQMAVKDVSGAEVDTIDLKESVFGVAMNEAVVYQALIWQRANERQGTASAKTRGEVAGSTRKPWRQKHTGRARVGTRMSPLWRHGGVTFGPRPRDFSQRMPRKMRRLAVRCLLSSKREDGALEVLKALDLQDGKTREMKEVLAALEIAGSVLVVMRGSNEKVVRSAKNLNKVKTLPAALLNAGDLLRYRHLVMTVDAVRFVEEQWDGVRIDRKRVPSVAPQLEVEPTPPQATAEAPAQPEAEEPPAPEVTTEAVSPQAPERPEKAAAEKPAPARRRAPSKKKPKATKADGPQQAQKPKATKADEPQQAQKPKTPRRTTTRSRTARKKAES